MTKLPQNFMWGGALAVNRPEGGRDKGGKGLNVIDVITSDAYGKARQITESIDSNHYYPSHEGTDLYHRYKEDIALFKEIGLKCLCTSIAQIHISPNGDEDVPNEGGLTLCGRIFDESTTQGIEPIVALSYFEMPLHLAKHYDGFRNREVVNHFVHLAHVIFGRYKDKVTYWMTFNEMNNQMGTLNPVPLWANSGIVLTEDDNPEEVLYQVAHHEPLASVLTARLGKEINPEFKIGTMISYVPIYPYSCRPKDMMEAQIVNRLRFFFLDVQVRGYYPSYAKKMPARKGYGFGWQEGDDSILQQGTVDYIGFNYYVSTAVKHGVDTAVENNIINGGLNHPVENPYIAASGWGWAIDPDGLRYTLSVLYDRYQLLPFIAENGFGAVDEMVDGHVHDDYRIEYLEAYITTAIEAVDQDDVDLTGYTPWEIIDTVSFTTGEMKKHYSLVHVDWDNGGRGTMGRLKGDLSYWYQQVITSSEDKL